MNWKFWTYPEQIRKLKRRLSLTEDDLVKTLHKVALPISDPRWPAQLQALKERLATTPAEDALLAGVLGLIEANVRAELDPAVTPGLTTEEAHRFQGRLGMLLDLKRELEHLHREAVQNGMTAAK